MHAGVHRIQKPYTISTVVKRHKELDQYVAALTPVEAMLRSTPARSYEPLLQHYGMKTRWIDLVDNSWVALWFACHRALSKGVRGEFIHFERRSFSEDHPFAYVVIMAFDDLKPVSGSPGFFENDLYEVVDFRVAAPSMYLRPHAQHGVLFKKKTVKTVADTDCSSAIFGIVRISLADAMSWLGTGDLLTAHTIFPPAYYDDGYRRLLELAPAGSDFIGNITKVGP